LGALYTAGARHSEFAPGRGSILQRALVCEKRTSGRGSILQRARHKLLIRPFFFLKIHQTNYENMIENTNIF
jgi:hypothetical protein